MIPSLAVLNSKGATLQGNKLTLTGVSSNSIVFADRPVRAAGHVLTSHFIKEWDVGNDSFAKDPPNATISVLSNDGATVKDAVVILKAPKLEGDNLTFEVSVLEGDLTNATGAAALFIDWFAARGYGGRAVVGGGPAWHGAWYGHPAAAFGAGVAVGAVGAAVTASLLLWAARVRLLPLSTLLLRLAELGRVPPESARPLASIDVETNRDGQIDANELRPKRVMVISWMSAIGTQRTLEIPPIASA